MTWPDWLILVSILLLHHWALRARARAQAEEFSAVLEGRIEAMKEDLEATMRNEVRQLRTAITDGLRPRRPDLSRLRAEVSRVAEEEVTSWMVELATQEAEPEADPSSPEGQSRWGHLDGET